MTGHYIYIETSSPRKEGDKAILAMHGKSNSERDKCMHFYYHMKGTNIGKLIIGQKTRGNIHSTSKELFMMTLWKRIGEQGSDWLKAEVNFKTFIEYSVSNFNIMVLNVHSFDTFFWLGKCGKKGS